MILVTGASGFIGRSLARSLDHAGCPWRPYSGRMNAPLTLRAELDGVSTVIHLAGTEARGRKRLLQHVDVEGAERLIEEAQRAGVSHLIIPSRLNADPHSLQTLLRSKGEIERMIQRSGVPYTILRTVSLFGRDDRFTEIITALAYWSWPFAWLPGGGKAPTQPLWVEDYARCLLYLANEPRATNRIITVGGAERLSYRDMVKVILHVTGLNRVLLNVPMGLTRLSSRLLLSWWYWPPVSRFFLDRFFVPEVCDLDSIPREFGFQPARFAETITYLKRRGMRRRLFRH